MGNSKLTLIGLYNYDGTILDNFSLPSTFTSQDVEDFKMNLLMEAGEFEVLYSNPTILKNMIGFWSRVHLPNWEHLYETMHYQYDPIKNYDRTETHTLLETRNLAKSENETRNLASSDTETRDLSYQNTETRDLTDATVVDREITGNSKVDYDTDDTQTETRALTASESGQRDQHNFNNETKNLATSGTDTGTVGNSGSSTKNITNSGRAYNDATLVAKDSSDETGSSQNTETRNLATSGTETGTDNFEFTGQEITSGSSTQGGTVTITDVKDQETVTNYTDNEDSTTNITHEGEVHLDGTDEGTITKQGTNTGTIGKTGTDTGTISHSETISASGNIGTMTSQQMIEQERDLAKFNLVDYIIREYKLRFCILKY